MTYNLIFVCISIVAYISASFLSLKAGFLSSSLKQSSYFRKKIKLTSDLKIDIFLSRDTKEWEFNPTILRKRYNTLVDFYFKYHT